MQAVTQKAQEKVRVSRPVNASLSHKQLFHYIITRFSTRSISTFSFHIPTFSKDSCVNVLVTDSHLNGVSIIF